MEKIKTAIASFGLSGQVFHAPFLAIHPQFELSVILERSKELSHTEYPQAKIVRTFEALLQEDVELVVVNTPDQTHYDYCRQALVAGKHVVVEKPFTYSLPEAEELIALARAKGLILTVYQNRRYDADFITLRGLLASGALGRVVEYHSAFQRYRPMIDTTRWRETPTGRNGITYDLCSHLSDQAVALFGKPEGVWATLASQRDGSQVDDYSLIVLKYPHLKVILRAGMLMREEFPSIALHGTAGSYTKYGLDPQEALLKAGIRPTLGDWAPVDPTLWGTLHTDAGRHRYPTQSGNYLHYYDALYLTLREGAPAPVSWADMLTDLRILEAAFESNETGCTVRI